MANRNRKFEDVPPNGMDQVVKAYWSGAPTATLKLPRHREIDPVACEPAPGGQFSSQAAGVSAVSTCPVKPRPRRYQLCDLRLEHVGDDPLQKGPNFDTGVPAIGALREQSDHLISISAARPEILPTGDSQTSYLESLCTTNLERAR